MADKREKKKSDAMTPEKLAKSIQAALDSCILDKGFVKLPKETGWGWSTAEDIESLKGKYIDRGAAWSALVDLVKNNFAEIEYKERPSGALKDALDVSAYKHLCDRIINFFLSLPRKYTFYFRLGTQPGRKIVNRKFSNCSEILTVTKTGQYAKMKKAWDDKEISGFLSKKYGKGTPAFYKDNTLIKIEVEGYVDLHASENFAAGAAISKLKNILYFGKTYDVFEHNGRSFSLWGGGPLKSYLFIADNETPEAIQRLELSHDLSLYLAGFELAPQLKSKKFKIDLRLVALDKIGSFLNENDTDPNKVPIITALQWAFEAAASSNQTVAFIQLCIGLEALLGDDQTKDKVTTTLADRCAYSLKGSFGFRSEVRRDFKKLYDHRSKLVHGRRLRIDSSALVSFRWGAFVLEKLIRNELVNFSPTLLSEEKAKI